MMDVINYIRNFVAPRNNTKQKRGADIDLDSPILTKMRRIDNFHTMSKENPAENWLSASSTSFHRRRSVLDPMKTPLNPREFTINLDDNDDDVIEIKKDTPLYDRKSSPVIKSPATSTPNFYENSSKNGNTFRKYRDSPIIRENSRLPISYKALHKTKPPCPNGKRPMTFSNIRDFKSNLFLQPRTTLNSPKHSSSIEESFRLEEKRRYKELLSTVAPSCNLSKLFSLGQRGKKMLEMTTKQNLSLKSLPVVDLTTSSKSSGSSNKLSTRSSIIKILDDLDTEVIKDSDSDVEILPNPPSPKPDIKVDRINSLKNFADPSEPNHPNWIDDILQRHRERFSNRDKLIAEQQIHLSKLADINTELKAKSLEENVKRCLKVKDAVVPEDDYQDESKLPELSEEQHGIINAALNKRLNPGEILSRKFNLNIARRDMLTLAGLNWLNDEVINFYMSMIIERGKLDKFPKAFTMNTFFYMKLAKDGYQSLRRWTKKVDIFSYDLIAVPIHLQMHWCMAIIDFRKRAIEYYDSMGSPNNACLEHLRRYLVAEHRDKKGGGVEYDVSDWKLMNVRDIPQQMNGSDCGMFACMFAEYLTRDARITFVQEDMPYFRRKMVMEIIDGRLMIS